MLVQQSRQVRRLCVGHGFNVPNRRLFAVRWSTRGCTIRPHTTRTFENWCSGGGNRGRRPSWSGKTHRHNTLIRSMLAASPSCITCKNNDAAASVCLCWCVTCSITDSWAPLSVTYEHAPYRCANVQSHNFACTGARRMAQRQKAAFQVLSGQATC